MTPPDRLADEPTWHTRALTTAQIETKLQAVQAHQTQLIFDRKLLESFVRNNELFGDFPEVDLRTSSDPVSSTSDERSSSRVNSRAPSGSSMWGSRSGPSGWTGIAFPSR